MDIQIVRKMICYKASYLWNRDFDKYIRTYYEDGNFYSEGHMGYSESIKKTFRNLKMGRAAIKRKEIFPIWYYGFKKWKRNHTSALASP